MFDVSIIFWDFDFSKIKLEDLKKKIPADWIRSLSTFDFTAWKNATKRLIDAVRTFPIKTYSLQYLNSLTVTNSINFQDSAQITIPAKTNQDLSEIMKNVYPGAFCEIQLFNYRFIGVVYSVSFTESISSQYNYEITARIMFPLNLMHSVSLGFFRKFATIEQDNLWQVLLGYKPNEKLMILQKVEQFIKYWLNVCSAVVFCVNREGGSLFDFIDTDIEVEDFDSAFLNSHKLVPLKNKQVYIYTPSVNLEGTLIGVLQSILQDDEIALDCAWVPAEQKFKVRLIRVPMAPKELLEGIPEKNKFSIEKPSRISFSRDTSRKLYFALIQPIQILTEPFAETTWILNILHKIGRTPSFLSARTSFGVDKHAWTTIQTNITPTAQELEYASKRVQMKNMSEGFAMKGSVEEHGIQNLNNIINRGLYVVEIPSENIIGWCTDISYRLQQTGTSLNAFTDYSIQFAFYKDEPIVQFLNEVYNGYFGDEK
jgi:hypothetical protein